MADISKITLPNGNTYDIKDATARAAITAFAGGNAVVFMGVSSTALTDGGNDNPTVGGVAVTTKAAGQLYFYGTEEFVYGNDNKWHALGSLESLGTLAYKNAVTVKYDKASVNTKTFSGTAVRLVTDNIAVPKTYTTTFTGKSKSVSVTGTPSGTVTQPTFTGDAITGITVSKADSGTATYTPEGTVTAPTITTDANMTTSIKNPTSKTVALTVAAAAPGATAPSNALTYYDVTDETLSLYQLGYTTGASITTSNVSVLKGAATFTASQPSFTGTGARLVAADHTPTGTVSQPTFSGNSLTSTGSYTPEAQSISTTTATTENKTTTVTTETVDGTHPATFTPAGSIDVTLTQTNTDATVGYTPAS